jgi:phosphatidylethanolamine-binding protein (PEBP) family uncharacterized protein
VLFVINFTGQARGGGPIVYWAVGEMQPVFKGVPAGSLPPGAIVGRNSFGQDRYSICPAKGSGLQHYVVALFALNQPLSLKPGFAADALYKKVEKLADYKGLAGFTYTPR